MSDSTSEGKATSTVFKEQDEEKKGKYQQRVLDVEMGSFIPPIWHLKIAKKKLNDLWKMHICDYTVHTSVYGLTWAPYEQRKCKLYRKEGVQRVLGSLRNHDAEDIVN